MSRNISEPQAFRGKDQASVPMLNLVKMITKSTFKEYHFVRFDSLIYLDGLILFEIKIKESVHLKNLKMRAHLDDFCTIRRLLFQLLFILGSQIYGVF